MEIGLQEVILQFTNAKVYQIMLAGES